MSTHREDRKLAPIRFTDLSMLKLMCFWDPLYGDMRFEKIVASLAPKESAAAK